MRQLTDRDPNFEAFQAGIILMFVSNAILQGLDLLVFDPLEQLAVFTSFICTYLCVIQSRWNYAWGVLTVAVYSLVFYRAGLYGSMALNIYLIPTLMYGWFVWGPDEKTIPVEHVKMTNIPLYLLATCATYVGAYWIISLIGGDLAGWDAWILIGSILAQFLLDRKKIETWLVWFAVNVVSIQVYWASELYAVAIQYCFFLLNTSFGAYMWYQSMKDSQNVETV